MTAEFTQGISSGKDGGQKGNGGPSRIEARQPTFFSDLDARSYADAFSSMEGSE